MKTNFLLIVLLIALLSSCNKTKPAEKEKSKFIRVWFDTVQSMPFMARLEIKSDNTFEYIGGACESSFGCNGKWKITNDTIILKSTKPKDCRFQNRFGVCMEIDEKYFENNKTIKGCEPDHQKSDYEIFENEKFYLRNDTLIHAKKLKDECPNLKIAFSMYEKIRPVISK